MGNCNSLELRNFSEAEELPKVHKKSSDIKKWLKFILLRLFLSLIVLALLIFYIIFWKDFRTVSSIKNIYQFADIGNQNRVIVIDWIIIALIPGLLIVLGTVRKNKITQYKTGIFVLRSKRALRAKNTWFTAQDYLGKICVRIGIVVLVLSEAMIYLYRKTDIDTLAFLFIGIPVCQVISYIIPFILTQWKLKRDEIEDKS